MRETQSARRDRLIRAMLDENPLYSDIEMPGDEEGRERLLRTLWNVRPAAPVTEAFARTQDAYLKAEIARKGIVGLADMEEALPGIYLWQGDITRVATDAIVNAANSGLTGCYRPNHICADNCIHTFAGTRLREACDAIARTRGYEEPAGRAIVTEAYALPCGHVIHTVAPEPDAEDADDTLRACYRACMEACAARGFESVAFVCVGAGLFGFEKERAAKIATETVLNYLRETGAAIKVVFDVFTREDYAIYSALLKG